MVTVVFSPSLHSSPHFSFTAFSIISLQLPLSFAVVLKSLTLLYHVNTAIAALAADKDE